jgi:hypothetical protein
MSEVASVLGKEGAYFCCLLWDDFSVTGYVMRLKLVYNDSRL